jgi:hypothetical protein
MTEVTAALLQHALAKLRGAIVVYQGVLAQDQPGG